MSNEKKEKKIKPKQKKNKQNFDFSIELYCRKVLTLFNLQRQRTLYVCVCDFVLVCVYRSVCKCQAGDAVFDSLIKAQKQQLH